MATNIEIKARIKNDEQIKAIIEKLSDTPCEVLQQEDIFFNIQKGRLKLRLLGPTQGELIHYERRDASGPRRSDYSIFHTQDPAGLKTVLGAALGVRGTVRKQRRLYRFGQTRVHLDEVEGLGTFLELEVVLSPGQNAVEGENIARELMEKLGLQEQDLVEQAYMDLLENRSKEQGKGSF